LQRLGNVPLVMTTQHPNFHPIAVSNATFDKIGVLFDMEQFD